MLFRNEYDQLRLNLRFWGLLCLIFTAFCKKVFLNAILDDFVYFIRFCCRVFPSKKIK